jgi:hypothetical protein
MAVSRANVKNPAFPIAENKGHWDCGMLRLMKNVKTSRSDENSMLVSEINKYSCTE